MKDPVSARLGMASDDPEAETRMALGVEIDDQHPSAAAAQLGGYVHHGGRFADAALAVGDGDHARGHRAAAFHWD